MRTARLPLSHLSHPINIFKAASSIRVFQSACLSSFLDRASEQRLSALLCHTSGWSFRLPKHLVCAFIQARSMVCPPIIFPQTHLYSGHGSCKDNSSFCICDEPDTWMGMSDFVTKSFQACQSMSGTSSVAVSIERSRKLSRNGLVYNCQHSAWHVGEALF